MTFTSSTFLFAFLPLTILIYIFLHQIRKERLENIFLLVASCVFYAWSGVQYFILLMVCVGLSYVGGLCLEKFRIKEKSNKYLFIFLIVFNLVILGVFKYFNFFIDIIEKGISCFFEGFIINEPVIPLPLGISFFTFQIISYLADIYFGKINAQKDIVNYSLFITFFPKLIMGPIIRYSDMSGCLRFRTITLERIYDGSIRFVKGFIKKMLLANQMGNLADSIFMIQGGNNFIIAWIGAIAYTLQIYIDFSSYTDMAIGLGNIFGFDLSENFNYPYIARSIQEFWRRWHITLSNWFRDYVYIPLGGNRKGVIKTYRNLGIVFLLTGIWHGASWGFIFWGIFHGIFLIIERIKLRKYLERLPHIIAHIYTLIVVIIGWVFFRSDTFSDAIAYIRSMFTIGVSNIWQIKFWENVNVETVFFFIVSLLVCYPVRSKYFDSFFAHIILIVMFLFSVYFMLVSSFNPFIYIRF